MIIYRNKAISSSYLLYNALAECCNFSDCILNALGNFLYRLQSLLKALLFFLHKRNMPLNRDRVY